MNVWYEKKDRIQTPLSGKFPSILWWVFIKIVAFLIFWRSLVIIFKFFSDKSLLENFLLSFFVPESDPEKFENPIQIQAKTPDPDPQPCLTDR